MQSTRVVVLLAVMVGLSATTAQAGCVYPIPELLWMSPAKNAVDVPTNAALIVGVAPGVVVSAFLDDQPLDRLENGAFAPLSLAADTTYKVRVELGEGATVKKVVSTFTTGNQTEPDVTQLPTLLQTTSAPSDTCSYMAQAQWCVDDQAEMVVLSVSADGVGWQLTQGGQNTHWSADCMPQVPLNQSACYQIAALSASGAVSPAVEHCVKGASSSSGGGCAISAPRSGRASILPLACALLGFMGLMKRLYGQDD